MNYCHVFFQPGQQRTRTRPRNVRPRNAAENDLRFLLLQLYSFDRREFRSPHPGAGNLDSGKIRVVNESHEKSAPDKFAFTAETFVMCTPERFALEKLQPERLASFKLMFWRSADEKLADTATI